MSRYIDADKLWNDRPQCPRGQSQEYDKGFWDCIFRFSELIHNSIKNSTADVVEVRHGEWVVDAYKGDEIVRIPYVVHEHDEPYCSLCGTYALLDGKEDYVPSNFCPRCGAKMDGERREENEG